MNENKETTKNDIQKIRIDLTANYTLENNDTK